MSKTRENIWEIDFEMLSTIVCYNLDLAPQFEQDYRQFGHADVPYCKPKKNRKIKLQIIASFKKFKLTVISR